MQEYLAAKRQFREKFAKKNPTHPHLGLIDADIAQHEAVVRLLDGQSQAPRAEAPKPETARFSPETRKTLEEAGYRIYELSGQSLASMRDSGRRFWSTWHSNYPDFEALSSRLSEVAIDPTKLFLPRSNNKTFEQQLLMVTTFAL